MQFCNSAIPAEIAFLCICRWILNACNKLDPYYLTPHVYLIHHIPYLYLIPTYLEVRYVYPRFLLRLPSRVRSAHFRPNVFPFHPHQSSQYETESINIPCCVSWWLHLVQSSLQPLKIMMPIWLRYTDPISPKPISISSAQCSLNSYVTGIQGSSKVWAFFMHHLPPRIFPRITNNRTLGSLPHCEPWG